MSRKSPGQRWCSLALLALFLSLFMYYGLPVLAFRIGQVIEAGRRDGQAEAGPDAGDGPGPDEETAHMARASREIRPAVVRIEALRSGNPAGAPSGTPHDSGGLVGISHGCGLVIDRQGWVVTSRRVVCGATALRIHLPAYNDPFPATVAGCDAGTDLAVLKFDTPAGWAFAAPLGDGAPVEIGECVVALGSSLQLGEFLWVGEVNSSGAQVPPACCNVHDCIHTTAVSSWNLGGPLLNGEGTVVGINTALREADGIPVGVAVPAGIARQVVAELRSHGRVRRGWLGIFVHKAIEGTEWSRPAAMCPERALAVAVDYVVPDSPAEAGGILAGDVICQLAGAPFESPVDLRRRIAGAAPGATVGMTLVRDGVVAPRHVVVGEAPTQPPPLPGEHEWGIRLLGHLSPLESRRLGVDHLSGVVVHDVEPGRKAKELSPHDVIVSVNGVATPDLATFCHVVERLSNGTERKSVALKISSRGAERIIVIAAE
jgi:serine protease Do